MEWEGMFGKKFQCYERQQWSLEKNSTAMNKNSEFGKIVVIEFIDMSGVMIETLLYTSGIWEKAIKLLRVTALVVFYSNSNVAQKRIWQPCPKSQPVCFVYG